MSYIDLKPTLAEWPYDAEQISVRKILANDGQIRIQMRVELGVLQMETEGRPDGMRPHGNDSFVSYHRDCLAKYEQRNGNTLEFLLSPHHCQDLRFEASLYYRRYVALFVLEEYASVSKDTSHNLAIFDLCRDYASEAEDRTCLEPFRPYVLMMDARSRAYDAVGQSEPASALAHVNRGILNIKAFYADHGNPDAAELSEEFKLLRALTTEIGQQVPEDSLLATRKALRVAIEQERFEDAARLRDELGKIFEA